MALLKKQDGLFDGFDPKTVYQMIPAGQLRTGFSITTDGEAVEVSIEPSGFATFAGPRTFNPPTNTPVTDTLMRLGPKTTTTFNLFGKLAGQATLVIRNQAGKPLETLLISVKNQVAKSYSLSILNDRRRRSPWLPPNDPTAPNPPAPDSILRPMMNGVRKAFLDQANVLLSEKAAQIFECNVNDRDLGDPIVLNSTVLDGTETKSLSQIIVGKMPLGAFAADFRLIFTWGIRNRKSDFVGLTIGTICYVEFNSNSMFENAVTTAHELGHAMGLMHNGRDVLMAGDGITRSSRLEQFEIDTINTSGTDQPGP